jgi:osmotically-inducible protein OsmY
MKSRFAVPFIVLGFGLGPLAAHAADKPADKKDATPLQKVREVTEDTTVTTKIKGEFAKDKTVSGLNIHVETTNGVVTLSGNAKTREEAEKAVTLAKSTAGVTSVKNDIKIGPPARK